MLILLELCAVRFGEVTEVRIITDRETNLCKGFSFIGFASREQAAAAKEGELSIQWIKAFVAGYPLWVTWHCLVWVAQS